MADASSAFVIRALAVTNSSWTPLTTPIACNTWSIMPDDDVLICTDEANPSGTEMTVKAGMQEAVQPPREGSGTRYAAGTTLAYLQGVNGSTIVRAQFSI